MDSHHRKYLFLVALSFIIVFWLNHYCVEAGDKGGDLIIIGGGGGGGGGDGGGHGGGMSE